MSRLETPFRYDHVGSFLRPEKLKEARRKFDDGAIGYDELKKVEDEAITELVGRLKEIGYHVITDGEFREQHGILILCGDLTEWDMLRQRQTSVPW